MKTPASSMLLVIFASLIGSFGAVFLKLGAEKLRHGIRNLISLQAFTGVVLFLISSFFFALGIKHGELSVLYPMVSLSYVFTMIWSRVFFKEPITTPKYVALGLILTGTWLMNVSAG
ncbi:MAG: EamA family transporter [Acidobacteriota bacterium]|nr:EamA family transporter [Acidobacteriota bacterium]